LIADGLVLAIWFIDDNYIYHQFMGYQPTSTLDVMG
jgi:hypothetical protein